MTASKLLTTALVLAGLLNLATALRRTIVSTPHAPAAIGPYSQAVMLEFKSGERMVHAAGQIGMDPASGELVPGGIENETHRALSNVEAIMTAAGAKMADVVECTVLMANLTEYAALNGVYAQFFDADNAPARAAFQVGGLPKGAGTEIKCTAAIADEA